MGCNESTLNNAHDGEHLMAGSGGSERIAADEAAALLEAQKGLSSRVQLSISCKGLVDLDTFSKSGKL